MEERYDPEKATYPFELEAFLSQPVQDLFNLLNSTATKTTQVFRTLAALSLRNLGDDIFRLPENQYLLRHVAVEGITSKNRKLAYNLFCQLYLDQLDQIILGHSKQIGYVYFMLEKNMGV